jgi:HK97 family phage portal protein
MRALVARSLRTVLRAIEGGYRPGPYYLPITGGWLPAGAPINFWQTDQQYLGGTTRSAMVEACISAYAQTIAMCPGDHWRGNSKGGRTRVTNSALARILRYPNEYQSISDFMLNATRSLYLDGNCYALALRNNRYEIDELHLMRPRMSFPRVAMNGEIFYTLGGNDVIARRFGNVERIIVPARDVLHIRLHTDMRYPNPLVGESPVAAAMLDVGVTDAILQQQVQFYLNEARPSAVLSTDMELDKDQTQAIRDRWEEQTTGENKGKTPVLTSGFKVQPWGIGGRDAQIAEMAKLSAERIALAFRVPLQILGLGGGPSYGSAEALMAFWVASGLGFALNHIEEAIGVVFQLAGQPDEYVEFNTQALLRSALKDRIEALARGVQGGIYSPNEARNQEGLDDVKSGDEPRVQQQVVPLSAAEQIVPTGAHGTGPHPPPAPGPAAPTAAPPAPAPEGKPQPAKPKDFTDVRKRAAAINGVFVAAGRINRAAGRNG